MSPWCSPRLFLLVVLCLPAFAQAQVGYLGGTYNQSFDSLNSTNTGTHTWSNNGTIVGWYLFRQPDPGTALTTYDSSDGGASTGSIYSFGVLGTNAVTDRALGGIGSNGTYWGQPGNNSIAGWIAVGIQNNSQQVINEITINYDGEQWRQGGNQDVQTMVLEYGFGDTFETVTNWTAPGAAYNFDSVVNTAQAGALDGNLAANRTANIGGTLNITWQAGQTLWFRWLEVNNQGPDHGLAIDNFQFTTPIQVPEPSTVVLIALAGLVSLRRKLKGRLFFTN